MKGSTEKDRNALQKNKNKNKNKDKNNANAIINIQSIAK